MIVVAPWEAWRRVVAALVDIGLSLADKIVAAVSFGGLVADFALEYQMRVVAFMVLLDNCCYYRADTPAWMAN